MKATVMTTGPGVIIATATASRNCRSVSQWYLSTTPPCRNGTMASPLPNTNNAALAKYARIVTNEVAVAEPAAVGRRTGKSVDTFDGATCGNPNRAITGTTPLAMNNQTTSVCVQAVTTTLMLKRTQSRRSRPRVVRTSLRALLAMIAITAAPTP